jgi:glycosyltransferase involved in cell wall biosynthesis
MINGKKIAIDARMIEMSGIGTYIQHLMGQNIYDIAVGDPDAIRKYDDSVDIVPFHAKIYGLKEQFCFPEQELKHRNVELIHFPHYNVPLFYQGKFAVTVHDLTHLVCPEAMDSRLKAWYAKKLMGHSIKKSEIIFTDSHCSEKDIHTYFEVPSTKIHVIYDAVDASFHVKECTSFQYLYYQFHIPHGKQILLYVGNLKPHKNLKKLLESYSLLDRSAMVLIVVGKEFNTVDMNALIDTLSLRDSVIVTGSVDHETLVDLYNLADVFVFPSLYEGFGLPPLEAMACGTPVVCSNTSSLPEIVGKAALFVDPYDSVQMSQALFQILHTRDLRETYVNRGFRQYRRYNWNKTVGAVRKLLIDIL